MQIYLARKSEINEAMICRSFLLSLSRQAFPHWRYQRGSHITTRRLSDKSDEENKFPLLKRSKMNVEERLGKLLQNENTDENKNMEDEKKSPKPKVPFKMRRRSLSPLSRVQNLIDENEKEK